MKKDYEEILNDGWADDVILEADRTSQSGAEQYEDSMVPDVPSAAAPVSAPVKKHRFRTFLIVWILFLTLAAFGALFLLRGYISEYQSAGEAADPDRCASELLVYFRTPDIDALMNMITSFPDREEFSTDEAKRDTLYELLRYRQISYIHADDSTEDTPAYFIFADDVIVAKAVYRKKPQASEPYGFPQWYLSELELYLPAPEDP